MTRTTSTPRMIVGTLVLTTLSMLGCQPNPTFEMEMMILELQTTVAQLETEYGALLVETGRVSRALQNGVGNLEASMNDLHLRVLDLSAGTDLTQAIREVEAAVAIANQRVAEVRTSVESLAGLAE